MLILHYMGLELKDLHKERLLVIMLSCPDKGVNSLKVLRNT